MEDIVIKKKTIRRELLIAFASFVIAYCCNIYAILHYHRPAVELVSTLGYVIFLALLIYIFLSVVRIVLAIVRRIFRKPKAEPTYRRTVPWPNDNIRHWN